MKNFMIVVLLIILAVVSFELFKISKSQSIPEDEKLFPLRTDTVYVDKPFKPDKPLGTEVKPITVTQYRIDTVYIDSIRIEKEIVYINTDKDTITYHTNFLTQYTTAPKLLQLDVNKKKLDLTLLSTEGTIRQESHNVDLTKYQYRYTDGRMSAQRYKSKLKIGFQASYMVRPLKNFHDVNINIVLKTTKIYYIGGINTYYYPSLNNAFGVTPQFGIIYNF